MFGFGKPSPPSFAKRLIEEIARAAPEKKLDYDKDEFSLRERASGQVMSLSNVYQEHCAPPSKERAAREFPSHEQLAAIGDGM